MESGTVCVVGLGYIGLPTASLLANRRFAVHGVDLNPRTVEIINRGDVHIVEPGLDVLVMAAVQSGLLHASVEPAPSETFVIAVPTPLAEGHRPDVSHVEAATEAIAPFLAPGNLVILESTSPVGTTRRVAERLRELRTDLAFSGIEAAGGQGEPVYVAHCPERVLPGQILHELVDNDRIVGGIDAASAERARRFYRKFVSGEIVVTDAETAEMSKLVENAFRDVNVAFANELAEICEGLSLDVWSVIELANHHPRVDILRPGPGVGGHCIPIDPWFIIDSAPDRARLLRSAREVNAGRPGRIVERVLDAVEGLERPVVACLGLAYKSDVDDVRESPSVEIVRRLAETGRVRVLAIEPYLDELPKALAGVDGVRLVTVDALDEADAVAALVPHRPFRQIDGARLRDKILIDACGLWRDPDGTRAEAASGTPRS